ncbi:unnamed protein product [Arctia plantaginis]|uniref:Uncharacterized protein n=1 Tax=Arctia plantaginis TaxID=874455 RepID=A0A8S0ZM64_ARCPL|nr:unnamed protein product [Arctia plantaginis]
MKTVLVLAGLVAVAFGVATHDHKFRNVDADFVAKQKKVLSLFERVEENDQSTDCYKAGFNYNIEANIDKYSNKKAVEEFLSLYRAGHFKAFDKEIDFSNPKAINFVGNYWQTNADLYSEEHIENYQHSYEITARHVLSGSPKPYDKYSFMPSALDFYQTSLLDAEFASKQKKVLSLFEHVEENDQTAECHKVGLKYNIEANIDKYTNPLAVHTHHAEADNKFSVIVDSGQF